MSRPPSPRQGFFATLRAWLRRYAVGDAAAVAIVMALTLPVVVGATALAVDAGLWYADARHNQEAAEAVAYSAAVNYASTNSVSQAQAVGYAVAAQYGLANTPQGTSQFGVASTGNTWTINIPSASGPNAGVAGSVEAIVHRPENFALASMFMNSASSSGRAVAMKGGGNYCILILDPSSTANQLGAGAGVTTYVENGSRIYSPNCGIAINGTGSSALTVVGGSNVDAQSESIVGAANVNNGGSITNAAKTKQTAVADPYASVANPTPAATCQANPNLTSYHSGLQYLSPGTYCGLTLQNNGSPGFVMASGVYYIDGGCFCLSNATVTGTGVTIVLTGGDSNSSTYAYMNIGNNSSVTLSGMTTGYTAGLVFYADRRSPTTTESYIGQSGNVNLNITGAMYFPTQILLFANDSSTSNACTQVIAYDLLVTGGSAYNSTCSNAASATGTVAIGGTSKIVE